MKIFSHVCGETNHKFEPRYDEQMPENVTAQRISTEELEAIKTKIYRGDVCVYCGKIVNERES